MCYMMKKKRSSNSSRIFHNEVECSYVNEVKCNYVNIPTQSLSVILFEKRFDELFTFLKKISNT